MDLFVRQTPEGNDVERVEVSTDGQEWLKVGQVPEGEAAEVEMAWAECNRQIPLAA